MKKTHNPDESVRKEQFGAEESASETSELLNEETGADKLPDTENLTDNEGQAEPAEESPVAEEISAQTSPVTIGETIPEEADYESVAAGEVTIAEVEIKADADNDSVTEEEEEEATDTGTESEAVNKAEATADTEGEAVAEATTETESEAVTEAETTADA